MPKERLEPNPSSFVHSLRSVGYSLETAVADIIDNSISANADRIDIVFEYKADGPIFAIIDNGYGMSSDELKEAMRLGTFSPLFPRKQTDLGRFGLGMKTASFAICQRLTVVSSKDVLIGAQWDLEDIQNDNAWNLNILSENDVAIYSFLKNYPDFGTAVIWEKIDHIIDRDCKEPQKEFEAKILILEKHLSLTFHRYLDGERGLSKIKIFINGHQLQGFDPFNLKNPATQELEKDEIVFKNSKVTIVPYILPHHSKTSADEYEKYAGDGGYLANQGFYVYRNKRLIIHGSWFRLATPETLTKLARVKIDISNDMDAEWELDVKKSMARPPSVIRMRLKNIIEKIRDKSAKTYRARGRRVIDQSVTQMWEKHIAQGKVCYKINLDHPLVYKIKENIPSQCEADFVMLLDMLAKCFPTDLMFHDYATIPQNIVQNDIDVEELMDVAKKVVHDWVYNDGIGVNEATNRLSNITPFDKYWDAIQENLTKEMKSHDGK